MSRKSRSLKKQKNRNKFGNKSNTLNNLDSQIKSLFDTKEYSKLIVLLEPCLENSTLTESQLSSLAFALIEENGKENSEKAFDCISKIKNLTNRDRRVKGWCLIYKEQWADAVSLLEELYEEDKTPSALYGLCIALLKSRDIHELFGKKYHWSEIDDASKDTETISKLKKLLLEGLTKESVYLGFYNWLEEIYYYENNEKVYEDKRNLRILEDALSVFPDDENLRLTLAKRYEQINDVENITQTLDYVLNTNSSSGKIFIDSINAFLRIGKLEKALEYFNKAGELDLFIGEEKDVLRVKILYDLGKFEEANSFVEDSFSSFVTNPELKFGLLIQKIFHDISISDFDSALNNLIKVAEIRIAIDKEDLDYVRTPDITFGYKNQYDALLPHYVLHSEEIDSSLNDSIKNLIPYLENLENNSIQIVFEFLVQTYEIVNQSEEQIPELQQLLDFAKSKKLNTEKIWLNLYRIKINLDEIIPAIDTYLKYCFSSLEFGSEIEETLPEKIWYREREKLIPFVESIDKKTTTTIHKNLSKTFKSATLEQREKVFLPIFVGFWSKLLKYHEQYKFIVDVSKSLLVTFPNNTDLLWLHAYYSEALKASFEAENSYRELLTVEPENASALHNLALILNRFGNCEEAIQFSDKALNVAPKDEIINNFNKELHQDIKEFEKILPKWNALDFYKKKILKLLNDSKSLPSNKSIAREIGHNIQERAISGHLKKLDEFGWFFQDESGYRLNKFVPKLLLLSNAQFQIGDSDSSLASTNTQFGGAKSVIPIKTSIVRLDNRNPIKPIFNSNNEFIWYQEFTTFFPNYFVVPNTSLQTIFKYDTMKILLNPDDFNYYLMASVDICVISTQDFLPKFGFEIDSIYHDEEKQKIRDERKNRIFISANLPLIRVRKDGVITREEIRNNIQEALASMPEYFKFPSIPKIIQDIESNDDGESVF